MIPDGIANPASKRCEPMVARELLWQELGELLENNREN